ncbi:nitrous oxide reductase accessory protein NosL [Shewanella sp. 1CM18E]|uniref:nitrous oxide reductase accessory protein NosL n=1 Tax=Shewanella sp. 1CM18E TaxID=2929169 RepID=UPI0020C05D2F|nr:nitrous oxide reductase accessory protein NosL [Shewanella sp. 1CM18E]MCK8046101.1 nitrous oxide reductase accessory protein NosL [Shewanella sp. 1CM18E]
MKKLIALLLLIPFLTACGESNAEKAQVTAQAIHEHDRCHLCGMMITKYPGPKGQVHLKGQTVVPKFCSTRDMFNFALQPENKRQIDALFVHDAGATDWEKPTDDAFVDAKTAWYVYGTSKKAVMGPAVASFKTQEAAKQFAQDFGGAVLTYEQIDISLLAGE